MKNLLTNNSGPSYVLKIYISSQNMELIIEYIYTGECEVESIQLSEFMKDVEYVHLNGLNLSNNSSIYSGKIVVRNQDLKI